MGQIVEFIGPAGVGKSTIFNEVCRLMPHCKRIVKKPMIGHFSRAARKLYACLALMQDMTLFRMFGGCDVLRRNNPIWQARLIIIGESWSMVRGTKVLSMLLEAKHDHHMARIANNNSWYLFDELFCQRVLSLAGRSRTPVEVATRFASLMPLPDVVFSIDAPSSEIVRRNIARAPHRRISGYPSLNPTKLMELTELAKMIISRTLSEVSRRGTEVVCITAMHSPKDIALDIASRLRVIASDAVCKRPSVKLFP